MKKPMDIATDLIAGADDREAVLAAAVGENKIRPENLPAWRVRWDREPKAAAKVIANLTAVPPLAPPESGDEIAAEYVTEHFPGAAARADKLRAKLDAAPTPRRRRPKSR